MYYQLTAEHISESKARKLLDQTDMPIVHARMDDTFTDLVHIVVETKEHAEEMQELLWKLNYGASCELFEVTEDDLEEYL